MLSRKLHDILDGEIITLEHLKKAKEGYTDQFSLDYQILEKGMEAIGFQKTAFDIRDLGHKETIIEPEPTPAQIKARRQKEYSKKVALFQREPLQLKKPPPINAEDIKNIKYGVSLYGRQIGKFQRTVQQKVRAIEADQKQGDQAVSGVMAAHYARQKQAAEVQMIEETIKEIRKKHSSMARS